MTLQVVAVLSVMLEAPESEWYGLELSSRASLKTGTIYPILARLEAAGWLQSTVEEIDPAEAGRPRRRLYRLTAEGELATRSTIANLQAQLQATAPSVRMLPQQRGQAA
jgi:PadR family transcriptional regulator PadR